VRRGLTATVIVLGALALGTGAFAWHLRPNTAVAVSVAAVLLVGAGALAANSRNRSFVRRGLTATVIVLGALALGTGAFAWYLRPNTAIPQPGASEIDLTFGPTHLARSPIKVDLTLAEDTFVAPGPPTAASLIIYLTGPDLGHPGWELAAHVPSGVQIGALTDHPHAFRITHGYGEDVVYAGPGAILGGSLLVELRWYNLNSGPLQVQGANLAAAFPDLQVDNQGSRGSTSASLPPVSVIFSRSLEPEGDYAFLAGLPPDYYNTNLPSSTWSWKPVTLPRDIQTFGGASRGAYEFPVTVEARSATADEEAQAAEFQSGILFGVAAAALIVALQEFVNTGRKREDAPARQSAA
jgi:hypothetical protein